MKMTCPFLLGHSSDGTSDFTQVWCRRVEVPNEMMTAVTTMVACPSFCRRRETRHMLGKGLAAGPRHSQAMPDRPQAGCQAGCPVTSQVWCPTRRAIRAIRLVVCASEAHIPRELNVSRVADVDVVLRSAIRSPAVTSSAITADQRLQRQEAISRYAKLRAGALHQWVCHTLPPVEAQGTGSTVTTMSQFRRGCFLANTPTICFLLFAATMHMSWSRFSTGWALPARICTPRAYLLY